jgi:UDP-N-acetylmuramoylalanine--D-glutamate ligase
VLGLARSGSATVKALLASGAQVVAWDESEAARAALQSSPAFAGEGVEAFDCPQQSKIVPGGHDLASTHAQHGGGAADASPPTASAAPPPSFGRSPSPRNRGEDLSFADPLTLDLTGFAGVVVAPGVPINKHPIVAHARAQGVPLIGDIELFAQARSELPAHKVVGITGTNGKSTTTALVHHILKTAGVPTTMGGNIGLPILAQDPLPEGGVYVLELSSYQIDLTYSLDCDVAVLLNITPDHLDRYDGSFEAYSASKARLFEMQLKGEHAYAGADNGVIPKVAHDWGAIPVDVDELEAELFGEQSEWPALQGPHNKKQCAGSAFGLSN